MKIMLFSLVALFGLALSPAETADDTRMKRAVIQTNAQCGMCEERIESTIGQLEGVVRADLDLTSRKLRVRYNDKLISLDEIRTAVSETGYAADDVAAVPSAVEALPACCKPKKACKPSCSQTCGG